MNEPDDFNVPLILVILSYILVFILIFKVSG